MISQVNDLDLGSVKSGEIFLGIGVDISRRMDYSKMMLSLGATAKLKLLSHRILDVKTSILIMYEFFQQGFKQASDRHFEGRRIGAELKLTLVQQHSKKG